VSQYLSRPGEVSQAGAAALSACQDFSRHDVLRILQITPHQLQGWERAGLITARERYTIQDLGQLRTVRSLRAEDVSASSIRHSIAAMQAVSGMANPLQEATAVRAGKQIVFRHLGAIVDPIRRQLVFDFEQVPGKEAVKAPQPLRRAGATASPAQTRFLAAVHAEEAGEKRQAMAIYEEIIVSNSEYAPAYINLGTIYFHLRKYDRAEDLYRRATQADPDYVLAFFDLGNVLDELDRPDESIEAYRQAVVLSPKYADAHYNLALAYERKGERRSALRHWQAYVRLDRNGPWSDHARGQIRKLLRGEKMAIAWRADRFITRIKGRANLLIVE
jgi:tetratricopeptide (TPR) repeat protein